MLIEYLYRKSIGARGREGGRSSQEPERQLVMEFEVTDVVVTHRQAAPPPPPPPSPLYIIQYE